MNSQNFLRHICKIGDWLPGWTSWLKPRHADALEIPADLEVEQSGVCFINGQDELDYLWYRLREDEGGREYAGYRVVLMDCQQAPGGHNIGFGKDLLQVHGLAP